MTTIIVPWPLRPARFQNKVPTFFPSFVLKVFHVVASIIAEIDLGSQQLESSHGFLYGLVLLRAGSRGPGKKFNLHPRPYIHKYMRM